MKKNFVRIIGFSVIAVLLLSASKPSIEGRALVGSENELPPGMYIKAATFLPGDTVVITNPATKTSIEVMVFSTFNASDGFAAILSPDVAKQLYISKNSDSIVQITKTGANTESIVLNRALNSVTEIAPADFVDDSEPYVVKNQPKIAEAIVEPVQTGKPVVGILDPPLLEDENVDGTVVFTPFSNMEDFYPSTQPTNGKAPIEDFIIEPIPGEVTSVDEFSMQDPLVELIPKLMPDEVALIDVPSAEEPIVEPVIERVPQEVVIIADPPVEDLVVKPITESIPEKVGIVALPVEDPTLETVIESIPEEVGIVALPVEDPTLKPVIESIPKEVVAVESVPKEIPNILTPALDYPPECAIADASIERLPDFFIYEEPSVVLIPHEGIISIETAESSVVLESMSNGRDDAGIEEYIRKYEVDNIESFGKGNFCIQLATYKDVGNIEKIINEYAEKYPVRLVKSEIIPDAYQVVVGPLNKDEYTIVLERFASWGFKNAFLRPIN